MPATQKGQVQKKIENDSCMINEIQNNPVDQSSKIDEGSICHQEHAKIPHNQSINTINTEMENVGKDEG